MKEALWSPDSKRCAFTVKSSPKVEDLLIYEWNGKAFVRASVDTGPLSEIVEKSLLAERKTLGFTDKAGEGSGSKFLKFIFCSWGVDASSCRATKHHRGGRGFPAGHPRWQIRLRQAPIQRPVATCVGRGGRCTRWVSATCIAKMSAAISPKYIAPIVHRCAGSIS